MKHINRSKTSTIAKSKFEKILGELFDVIVCPCAEVDCPVCEFDVTVTVTTVTVPKSSRYLGGS